MAFATVISVRGIITTAVYLPGLSGLFVEFVGNEAGVDDGCDDIDTEIFLRLYRNSPHVQMTSPAQFQSEAKRHPLKCSSSTTNTRLTMLYTA